MSRILVVDDDLHIRELINVYMRKAGFTVELVADGAAALAACAAGPPDLVILDLMLPGLGGWDVCRHLRQSSHVPIIMLTARGESEDRVHGLDLGADDYVVKPFDPQELVARVRAVLRRSAVVSVASGAVAAAAEVGSSAALPGLTVNYLEHSATLRGEPLDLTPREFELLWFFVRHPNQVFTRDQLLDRVWGFDYVGDARTVDVHVQRLRAKLGEGDAWRIVTVWRVGYKFEVDRP